jgi:phosphatidylinositol alpha-1,6-mannosyltransferase
LLITLEFPPDIGGIASYYHQIVKSDSSIKVLHLRCRDAALPRLHWFKFFKPVARKVKEEKINYLQIGHILPLGYLGLIFKLISKKPYLVYVHGLDVLQGRLSTWKKFWIKVILHQADTIVANSSFVKESVLKKYNVDAKKFRVVYPKVDVAAMEPTVDKLAPVAKPAGVKIILSVGRLVRRKGFDMVIRALALLHDCQYWIVGDGPDRERLELLVKKYNLENKVKFLGSIPNPQIYQYYKACDVFVMPCREIDGDVEGFGIVFLEAAAFGKPVIAGRSGGAPEAVIDGVTGLLVNPLDIDDIAQAMVKLLTNEALALKLGEQGYRRVCAKFGL